jgi:hypothetical protein
MERIWQDQTACAVKMRNPEKQLVVVRLRLRQACVIRNTKTNRRQKYLSSHYDHLPFTKTPLNQRVFTRTNKKANERT